MRKEILAQLKKLNPEKIHGNTKVSNLLTGERDRTMSQWRKQARNSVKNYKKMIRNEDEFYD